MTRSDLLRDRTRPGPLGRLLQRVRGDDPEFERRPALPGGRPAPAHPRTALVRDAMTTELLTARVTDSVADAAARMVELRLTSLPVVDEQWQLAGVVSEADLLGQEPLSGRADGRSVGTVMSRDVVTVAPDDSIGSARLLVAEHGLRIVPVAENGRLVGVLSRSDLI